MKKIIVPVDFSEQAAHALDLALQLADQKPFKVTVLRVIEFSVGGVVDPTGVNIPSTYDRDYLDSLKSKGKEQMEKFLSGVEGKDKLDVRLEIGNAYANIADKLCEDDYDMIIMGTKGASGMREFFIGSNTEKVVRTALCPVLAVREKVKLHDIKNIAFATAGEEPEVTEDLMMHVKQLQELFEAKIHVVRINTPNNFERDTLIRPLLKQMAERYMLKDYTLNVFNDVYEDQGIMAFADYINADMIAMGTHGRKGLGHIVSGSLAEDVVNHANKLIWTYHINKK